MTTKLCARCRETKNTDDFYFLKKTQKFHSYCKECCRAIKKTPEQLKKAAQLVKGYRDNDRDVILDHYGRFCICCDETESMFLTIDHVNNNGAEHRRSMGRSTRAGSTAQVYRDVIKNNFPDEYQILCYNCNCGRQRNGGVCPHREGLLYGNQ